MGSVSNHDLVSSAVEEFIPKRNRKDSLYYRLYFHPGHYCPMWEQWAFGIWHNGGREIGECLDIGWYYGKLVGHLTIFDLKPRESKIVSLFSNGKRWQCLLRNPHK